MFNINSALTKVLSFLGSDEDYDTILIRLGEFLAKPRKYRYSFFNIFLMSLNIPYQRDYHFVCSSFVSYLLEGIIPLEKEISLVIPDDYNSLNLNQEYEGKLSEYANRKAALNNI